MIWYFVVAVFFYSVGYALAWWQADREHQRHIQRLRDRLL
jgi:DNA-binding transcriptional regulator of glucitol operon